MEETVIVAHKIFKAFGEGETEIQALRNVDLDLQVQEKQLCSIFYVVWIM